MTLDTLCLESVSHVTSCWLVAGCPHAHACVEVRSVPNGDVMPYTGPDDTDSILFCRPCRRRGRSTCNRSACVRRWPSGALSRMRARLEPPWSEGRLASNGMCHTRPGSPWFFAGGPCSQQVASVWAFLRCRAPCIQGRAALTPASVPCAVYYPSAALI